MNDGVAHSYIAGENEAGSRLDIFLSEHSTLSRSRVKKLILDGLVTVNTIVTMKSSHPVQNGDMVSMKVPDVEKPGFSPEPVPLDFVYRDDQVAVINKPAGMVVHPGRGNATGTLAAGLLYHCAPVGEVGDPVKPGIVHRLDMNTSGLLVTALTEEAFSGLSGMVRDREITRIYHAFVWGHPEPVSGTVDAAIGRHPRMRTLKAVTVDGRPSVTHYATLARHEFLSKLEVTLDTGRTHQIRVHMAHIGHHVFGDPSYGGREKRLKGFSPEVRDKARYLLKQLDRQALHACRLAFRHPVTGEHLDFEAPLPPDLSRLERELERA